MAEIFRRMIRDRVEREKRWERITSQQITMLVGAINEIIRSTGYRGKISQRDITIFTKDGEAFGVQIGSTIHPDAEKFLPAKFDGHEIVYERYAEYYDSDNTPQFFIEEFRVEFFEDHTQKSNHPRRYLLVHNREFGTTFKVEIADLNSADRRLLDETFPNGPEILR